MKLFVATKNKNKLREIKEILADTGFDVESAYDYIEGDVEETGNTFLANACLKAVEISKKMDGYILADDSGLSVDILGGEPGVYSARYAGLNAADADNNNKLLKVLTNVPEGARSANFTCVMALAKNGLVERTFSGICEGSVGFEPKGDNGFGYDPLFITEDGRTMAELDSEHKNRISHRSMALQELQDYLKSISTKI